MDEILQELTALINRVLPAVQTDNVSMESDIRTDLAIDSFSMILLAISIEEQFGIQLDEGFVPRTAGDVCKYILEKKQA